MILERRETPPAIHVGRLTSCRRILGLLALLASAGFLVTPGSGQDRRGIQFIELTPISGFTRSDGHATGELLLTSEVIPSQLHWDQLVASWNAPMTRDGYLKVEARALGDGFTTKYYVLGLWSQDPGRHPRESVLHQKDDRGDVATDTLVLTQSADRVQLRIILGGTVPPELKFLGLCLTDTSVRPPVLAPNKAAWGRTVAVPERSQMSYPNGNSLCSPTTVSMLLGFWSQQLKRADLDRDVPEVARGVDDPNWRGTGNWPFNMAFAGSLNPLRAYVTRFSDVSELEDWIANGIPVGVSLDYNKLRGIDGPRSGHLVVCVGFTEGGDVVVNDPGTRKNVRKTFPRANLIAAWANSHNAVYLIYPEDRRPPKDRFGHWAGYHAFQ